MDSFDARRWMKERCSYNSPVAIRSISFRDSFTGSNEDTLLEALYHAIESRDAYKVADALGKAESLDVNRDVPGYSMTLLHLAVGFSENEPDIVELLLKRGADPNIPKTEEKLSPLHLSVVYDYHHVMRILIEYGGDPEIRTGDGKTCYDIVRDNIEDMLENCFGYFFLKSATFRRKTMAEQRYDTAHDSGSDGFYSCDSHLGSEASSRLSQMHHVARRLFPLEYSNLMTEDDTANSSSDDSDCDNKKKLTTIPEESGIASSQSMSPSTCKNSPQLAFPGSPNKRGIGSMTAPNYYMTDDSLSVYSDISCVNSTPPIDPRPTENEMEKLRQQMKQLNLPITPSTFNVISKVAGSADKLQTLLTPKAGSGNYSSELQAGMEDLNLIHEWGNHKIDLLQNYTPTSNTSKSFFNYLLLDPKIIKRVNFSGNHLKTGVINSSEKFEKFLSSVFYVGKGHGKRPLQHLVEAKEKHVEKKLGGKSVKHGAKIDKILEIWNKGLGVMILNVFHHSSEREANVNEACMIDAIGLIELSNVVKGSYNGTLAKSWPQKIKNQLGSFLLYKAFCAFVVSDPKSFYPHDF